MGLSGMSATRTSISTSFHLYSHSPVDLTVIFCSLSRCRLFCDRALESRSVFKAEELLSFFSRHDGSFRRLRCAHLPFPSPTSECGLTANGAYLAYARASARSAAVVSQLLVHLMNIHLQTPGRKRNIISHPILSPGLY